MKSRLLAGVSMLLLGTVPAVLLSCAGSGTKEPERYNVIYILTDDLGYAELGAYGNTFNETPHLDRLAAGGIRFTQCYTAAPVCSPTRVALMTGKYPVRFGITDYLRPYASKHLDTAEITLAEMFRANGYRTGIVGKWHLSGYVKAGASEETLPDKHGFDDVYVSENQGIAEGWYFHPYLFNTDIEKKLPGEYEYITDRQHHDALEFMERNKDAPFFLYLSHYAVHTTVHGKPDVVDHFRNKEGAGKSGPTKNNPDNDPYKRWPADSRATSNNPHLAAQLKGVDDGIGMILQKLKELGLDRKTILVFTSDNGGEVRITTNHPLRGGKSMLYEGGVRVPLIIWAPDLISNGVVDRPVSTYDFYPTLMELIGASPNTQEVDGLSFAGVLTGADGSAVTERSFYWHYPLEKPHFLGGRSAGSIRKGDWKLIEFFDDGSSELYHLKDDAGENRNLAQLFPDKVTELSAELGAWRVAVQPDGSTDTTVE